MSRTTAVHLLLALPWLLMALALVILGVADANTPVQVAAIPLALSGVSVLLAHGRRLVVLSLLEGVVGFFALLAVSLNYIDHSPEREPARSLAEAADYGLLVLGVAVGAAVVVGVMEWRAGRIRRA
jgi:hypothetical protein